MNQDSVHILHRVALIGWPLGHSVSPAMHNAAFAALGLTWRYEALPTRPGRLAKAVARLRADGYRGANVTVPHKQTIVPLLDDLTSTAKAIGAVNTVVERGGKLIGHNTDADGFRLALLDARFRLSGSQAIVLGTGGGARAVVFALLEGGAEGIWLLGRSVERAAALAHDLDRRDGGPQRVRVLTLDADALLGAAQAAELLVHTTPVGMWPHTGASVWPPDVPVPAHLTVFDLVYNPPETLLLRQASTSGARPIGGMEMLVHQGAHCFETWTGKQAPVRVMRSAAHEAVAEAAAHRAEPLG